MTLKKAKILKSNKKPSKNIKVKHPITIENKYGRWIKQMMLDLHKELKKKYPEISKNFKEQKKKINTKIKEDGIGEIFVILSLIKRNFYKKYTIDKLKKQSNSVFNETNEFNRLLQSSMLNSLTNSSLTKKEISDNIILSNTSPSIQSQKQVFIRQNVKLIKSVPEKFFSDIEQDINRITAKQGRASELSETLQKRYNTSKSKADLIARDQVGKLNGNLAQQRQQDLGVDLYEWMDSDDKRVRKSHAVMDGKVCSWNDSSIYTNSVEDALAGKWKSRSSIGGVELHPQEDIRCRCVAYPLFDD